MGSPFWFFQVYCTIIKTYSGWFVNCVLFKSSHIKNAKKATRASAFVVDTLAALLFIPLWYTRKIGMNNVQNVAAEIVLNELIYC